MVNVVHSPIHVPRAQTLQRQPAASTGVERQGCQRHIE
jgi:hypothetical protein